MLSVWLTVSVKDLESDKKIDIVVMPIFDLHTTYVKYKAIVLIKHSRSMISSVKLIM